MKTKKKKMTKKEFMKLWVKALRSGKYEQGEGMLCQNNKYCCLGVACDLAEKHKVRKLERREGNGIVIWDEETGELPTALQDFLGMSASGDFDINKDFADLASLNDGGYPSGVIQVHDGKIVVREGRKMSFKNIARVIETYFMGKKPVKKPNKKSVKKGK